MTQINLIRGDCRIELEKIDVANMVIVTDPPYNQKYHYNSYKDNMENSDYVNMLQSVVRGRKAVVIHYPEEMMQIFGGGNVGNIEQVVSWVYNSNTAKQHRLIAWFGCKPDFRLIPQPYKNPNDKRIKQRIAEGKSARSYDWWNINQVKNVSKRDNSHPCPMPLEVMEKIILSTTKVGDTVCDPFMGSGTTGIAAIKHGRNFIGIESDKTYFDLAMKLLQTKQ